MTPQDFEFISSLLKKHSGFSLFPSQLYLLENRLAPILRQNNLTSLEELVTSLKLNNTELRKSVIEAVSVNNTRFFRNKYVFSIIENFVNTKFEKTSNTSQIRILSAGCASGQEPVSIALLLHEMRFKRNIQMDIFALDMSRSMIDRAKKALYTHYEVQKGLPIRMLLKYFTIQQNNYWQLNESVLSGIHYRTHNLMNQFEETNFDIILCRNMLSFMTEEAQNQTLENLSTIVNEEGLLIIGASEVLPENNFFEKIPDKIACYRLKKRVLVKEQKHGWTLTKKQRFKPAILAKN